MTLSQGLDRLLPAATPELQAAARRICDRDRDDLHEDLERIARTRRDAATEGAALRLG